MKTKQTTLTLALGAAIATSFAAAPAAADSVFSAQALNGGYMVADNHGKAQGDAKKAPQGKTTADKAAEGKCGGTKAKEGNCGTKEMGKGMEGKCGEGKCGNQPKPKAKAQEGKCGSGTKAQEGKCGGKK